MSHAPRPYSRAVADLAAPRVGRPGRRVARRHDVEVAGQDEPRGPPARPARPMTTGSDVRGISSPGQSGSARMAAGIRRDDLDRAARARASASAAQAATASSEPVIARDPDERPQVGDQPRRRSIAAPATRRSVTQDRPGHAGRAARAVDPDLVAGYVWTSQPAAARAAAVTGLPSARMTTPGRTARTLQPSVGNSSSGTSTSRMSELAEQLPQPDRQQRQEDDREVVGDRRDDAHQVDELGRALPVRDVEDADVAADERGQLVDAGVVRPQRPPDAEQVRPQPERVAALDRAGRLDPPERRDAGRVRPRLEDGRLAGPVRLARPERDRAAVGDEQRVERVDEVRVVAARVSRTWTVGAERRRAPRRTRRARAARRRGRPATGSRAPGRRRPARTPARAA